MFRRTALGPDGFADVPEDGDRAAKAPASWTSWHAVRGSQECARRAVRNSDERGQRDCRADSSQGDAGQKGCQRVGSGEVGVVACIQGVEAPSWIVAEPILELLERVWAGLLRAVNIAAGEFGDRMSKLKPLAEAKHGLVAAPGCRPG